MVKIGAYAYCIDNTGVYFVKIFQAIGSKYKREVTLGDVVHVTVRGINTGVHFLKDKRSCFFFFIILFIFSVFVKCLTNNILILVSVFNFLIIYVTIIRYNNINIFIIQKYFQKYFILVYF